MAGYIIVLLMDVVQHMTGKNYVQSNNKMAMYKIKSGS